MTDGQPESLPSNRPLSVALIVRRYDPLGGGAERWTHDHAVWLLQIGCRVIILAECLTGAPAGAETHKLSVGTRLYRHTAHEFAVRAADAIARGRPDVVVDMGHTWCGDVAIPHYGTRAANDRARMAMRSPLRRLLRRFSTAILPRRRRLAALERRMMQEKPLVVAVSSMTAGHLHADLDIDPSLIHIVPNGVDLARFRPPAAAERVEARRALGIGDRPVALLVAHDFNLKGVSTAVLAIGALHRSGCNAPSLIVIGRDPAGPVKRLATRVGVGHLVRVEGPRGDVRAYMHAADLLVHPTFYDPCSLVVLEAIACGLPVITTRQNGAAEQLDSNAECLILDDPRDHQALAALIARAIAPAANTAMRAAAEQRRDSLDSRFANTRLLDIYRAVSTKRQQGSPPPQTARTQPGAHVDEPSTAGGTR